MKRMLPGFRALRFFIVALFFSACFASFAQAAEKKVWNAYQTPLFSGSYNHGYKIDLPPGTRGMTPQLSISYSSYLAKNKAGWVGAGWEIPQSYIQTNTDGTYSLFLNGARHNLVYAAADSHYHTRIETYLKIEKKAGATNEKGDYWAIFDTNGTEYRFGFNLDSENMLNTSSPAVTPYVWRWSLDRIRDPNGNCIYFTYAENPTANDKGAVYLSKIEYNNEKKRLVEFILEDFDRPDITMIVDQGSEVQETRRLAEIRVSVNGQLAKKLAFQYVPNATSDTSLLSSITKYGSDGTTALPPERFEYTPFDDGIKTDLLTKITGSLGDSTTINYSPSSSALNTTFPENNWLVTSIAQSNGMTGPHALSAASTIAYENGAYDLASQEFRGFGKVAETRPDGSKTVHIFHQDDATKGREQSSTVSDAQNAPFLAAVNLWTSSLSNGVYTVRLEKTESYTYDGVSANPKITRTEYKNFDSYGNAGLVIDQSDIAVTGDETAIVREFVYNPDLWIVNKVKHSTITTGENGAKLRESWFYYDRAFDPASPPFAGNLTKEEHWNNDGANPVITYKYDFYGNLTRKTDPLGNSTEIVYDAAYNTFPVLVYNAKNHLTTTSFNPAIGKPISVTDPNGNRTSYTYDLFNRLTKIVKPGDSDAFPTTELQYAINDSPPHLLIVKNRETAGGGTFDSVQAVDGFGKVIQTKSESDNPSNMVASDTYYDVMGRAARQSNAYLTDSALRYSSPNIVIPSTGTGYDVLGRPTVITNPDGTFETNTYSHWTVVFTDENGRIKSQTFDANKKLVQVIENNQGDVYTTRYQYNALEELLSITDHFGNASTHEYDSLGRRIKTIDVDLGQRLFSYDLAGNMTSQTDARGIVIKYQYDALNRQTLIDYPTDKDIQFVYDLNTKGTLSMVYNSLGIDSFKYDERLRTIQEDRTMDGQTWTTKWGYDSMDRVIRQTYPDGEVVQYGYNARNMLAAIQRASQSILNNTAYNAAGLMTQMSYGNSWSTAFSYDLANLRLANISTTKAQSKLQDMSYTYDNAGNVKTLKDAVAGRTETFSYDDLYRMVGARDDLATGGFDKGYEYDAIGNLRKETDNKTGTVTRYSYGQGTARPHAVTGKTNTDGLPIVGSFVIDKGKAYCTKQQVTLDNISMGVTPGNAADFYMASEDQNFGGASWQPFSTSPVYTLTNLPTGFKTSKNITVYFKVKNVNGESKVKSTAIQWLSDVDGDGISDMDDTDNDNDGIPDAWETDHGLNPFDPSDATIHPPGDGLTYLQKYIYRLNPNTTDTDGDGWSDYHEVFVSKTNPNLADSDKDGIPDPTDPNPNNPYNDSFSANYSVKRWTFNAGGGRRNSALYTAADTLGGGFSRGPLVDSDGDGIPDAWEIAHGLEPANPADATWDADGDGLTNLQEYRYGTNPKAKDADGDGWSDYQEIFIYRTDPNAKDTDKDGIPDPQDPEPNKPTYIYGTSENFTIRNGNFNAGGNNRGSASYAVFADQIGGFQKDKAIFYAKFFITPEAVDFQNTEVNQSRTSTLTISNKGIENLIIGTVSLAGSDKPEFAVSQDNCSGLVLSPSVGCNIQISFVPKSPGAKGANLAVLYNDGEIKNASIAVSGISETASQRTLSITKTGSGAVTSSPAGINCGSDCSESYDYNTTVTLTASASSGWTFIRWSGDLSGSANPSNLIMTNPKTVTAEFGQIDSGIYHPADTTHDHRIAINECIAYGFAWKTGATWADDPNPIPIAYMTNGCYLWKIGEVYHFDASVPQGTPPYVTGEATSGVTGLNAGSSTGSSSVKSLPSGNADKSGDRRSSASTTIGKSNSSAPATSAANPPGQSRRLLTGSLRGFNDIGQTSKSTGQVSSRADNNTGWYGIKVEVTPGKGVQGYAVEEALPVGTEVQGINNSGNWDRTNGKVKWGPFLDNMPRTLQYQIRDTGMLSATSVSLSGFSSVSLTGSSSASSTGSRTNAGGAPQSAAALPPSLFSIKGVASFDGVDVTTVNTGRLALGAREGKNPTSLIPATWMDFDGDGRSDLAEWTQTGQPQISSPALPQFQDQSASQFIRITLLDVEKERETASYQILSSQQLIGYGDWDGDGRADILLRDDSGSIRAWLMEGTNVREERTIRLPVGAKPLGIGDVNGDGIADLLWRDAQGTIHTEVFEALSVLSPDSPNATGRAHRAGGTAGVDKTDALPISRSSVILDLMDSQTEVISLGDYDGDGRTDILWRDGNGALLISLMGGTGIRTIPVPMVAPSQMIPIGTGDMNGDGTADILWRNAAGSLQAWLMNGVNQPKLTQIGQPTPGWEVTGVGDYNGDGIAELLWTHRPSGEKRITTINALGGAAN